MSHIMSHKFITRGEVYFVLEVPLLKPLPPPLHIVFAIPHVPSLQRKPLYKLGNQNRYKAVARRDSLKVIMLNFVIDGEQSYEF